MRTAFSLWCALFCLLLAGCGGGSGYGNKTVAPKVRAQIIPGSNPVAVGVTWDKATDFDVVEYQVLRGDVIVGVTPPTVSTFTDEPLSQSPFVYQKVVGLGSTPEPTEGSRPQPFESGTEYKYQIRVVYKIGSLYYETNRDGLTASVKIP